MSEPTLDDAKALIERMKTIHPTCNHCARESADWFAMYTDDKQALMVERGWQAEAHQDSWVLRCYPCRETISYPWADKLDAEKVLAYMLTKDAPFAVSELERTLSKRQTVHDALGITPEHAAFARGEWGGGE